MPCALWNVLREARARCASSSDRRALASKPRQREPASGPFNHRNRRTPCDSLSSTYSHEMGQSSLRWKINIVTKKCPKQEAAWGR